MAEDVKIVTKRIRLDQLEEYKADGWLPDPCLGDAGVDVDRGKPIEMIYVFRRAL